MKVTGNDSTQPTTPSDKTQSQSNLESPLGSDSQFDGLADRPSFANVLDRVTQSLKDTRTTQGSEHSAHPETVHENQDKRKEETDEVDRLAVSDRSLLPQPTNNVDASPEAHTILPPEDLEKIVAACRVQVTPTGTHEVQLDLTKSVLDGLRVKVTSDPAGRVTTEFLAASESVKNLLDARSTDLLALLRSRGINVVSFKSSLAGDTNAGTDSGSRQQQESAIAAVATARATAGAVAENQVDDAGDAALGATYRA